MFRCFIGIILTLGVSNFAFAAEHKVSTDSTTHTYQIYQIFTGDYDSTSKQLQNLKYGANAKTGTQGEFVSSTDIKALDTISKKSYANDQEKIADLTPYVDLSGSPIAEIGKDKNAFVNLAEGYYIIKDTDNSLQDPETYTLYLFKVLGEDLAIQPKSSTTTVDKTVTETADATGTATVGQKGADYDEGDSIPYSINITLAENVTDYKTYTVTLTDTLSEGLTPPTATSDIAITFKDKQGNTIDGTGITGFTAPAASITGQVISVTFQAGNGTDAIGSAGSSLNGATINVSYNAVLNDKAKIGEEGNPNKYKIVYSNNPNGTDKGETPEREVRVYTYELDINKVDGNKEPLEGAAFTLYKEVTSTYSGATTGAAIKQGLAPGINGNKLEDAKYYVPVTMTEVVTKDANNKVTAVTHKTATKIDAGNYVLVETTIPDGYNAYAGENIVITSTIDADGNLTGLTVTPTTLTVASHKDIVSGEVENQSGAELPSTGGSGTTMIYIIGVILLAGAGILLVTRRRMKAE